MAGGIFRERDSPLSRHANGARWLCVSRNGTMAAMRRVHDEVGRW
ncbi:hypothetical protein RRSWK_04784 [Rhodopirellula sp. SWK7]|nr:hypothetical protein RRSWK_04784 [Rhodopirellula sp. SWK7]